jgi:glutathione S-transferase
MSTFENREMTVGYWGIRGLAAPLRMMVLYRNLPLKAENYDVTEKPDHSGFDLSCWFNHKPALKEKNPLINLPYVIDGDIIVTQSNACMHYVGRKLKLLGKNELELTQCEQLLCEIMDVRNEVVDFAYGKNGDGPRFIEGIIRPNRSLDKLNTWLARKYENSSETNLFFVGDEASAPDFHIWEVLDQLKGKGNVYKTEDPLKNFQKLSAFHASFRALPENQKYFHSKLAHLPTNNKSACYGSTPDGGQFVAGQATPWHGSSGVY